MDGLRMLEWSHYEEKSYYLGVAVVVAVVVDVVSVVVVVVFLSPCWSTIALIQSWMKLTLVQIDT